MKKKNFGKNVFMNEIMEGQANDLVLLGLLILSCCLGSFDLIDFADKEYFLLKSLFQDSSNSACCLLHCIDTVPEINNQIKSSLRIIKEVVNDKRFSKGFGSFLCKCLSFKSENSPNKIGNLIKHEFIESKNESGIPVSIKDLLELCLSADRSELPESIYCPGRKQLDKVIDAINVVIPNCKPWFSDKGLIGFSRNVWNFNEENKFFDELSWHFGIDRREICQKIKEALSTISFINRCKQRNN